MKSITLFFIIFLLMPIVTPVLCENKTVPSKPIVLMLIVESEALATLQEMFKDELAMELSTHVILTKSMQGFSVDGFSARLEDIRQIAVTSGAEVVIWLEQTNKDKVSMNLLAAAPDHAMLRSVGTTLSGRDTAGELAIAARELLEEMHINLKENPSHLQEVAPPSPPPDERNASPGAIPPSEIDRSNRRRTQLSLGLVTTGGFKNTEQSPIMFGGAVSIGLYWKSGLYADLSLDAFTNPSSTLQNGTFRTVGVRPGMGVGYLWERGLATFGPYLGLQAPWQTAKTAIGVNRESKDSWWNFRTAPSFDLRIRLHRNILLSMTPGLGILVHQEVFERVTDGVDIYESPYLDWHIKCGIIITLN
jgi:hypothetical protein